MIDQDFEIKTDRFVLRIIRVHDVENVFETMNSKNTANIVSFLEWPMTKVQAQKWCDKSVDGIKNQTEYLFIAQNGSLNIGCAGVHLQDHGNVAEIGYWVTESCQGKGHATEMAKATVKFAFDDLRAAKLFATADHRNSGSFRVLEKAGFLHAGNKDVALPDGSIRISKLYELSKGELSE